jgi:endonuclease YncB( thermonuclease family)
MTSKDTVLKTKAFMARDKLFSLITGKTSIDTISWRKKEFDEYFQKNVTIIVLECKDMDKYGRVLADVSNFADVLVREKLAYWYDGGKKLTEDEQKSKLI